MFTLNEDLSIYATRGDIVFFSVTAEDDGKPYTFQAGDVVRIKVYGKKNTKDVVLQKDFPVIAATDEVEIYLDRADTKIGDEISKPKDYWYSVTLNDDTVPQTLIGYDDDGAKVFKLYPEGADIPPYEPIKPEDIPVVDDELDLTSTRPVENKAIARAVVRLNDSINKANEKAAEMDAAMAVEKARLDNFIEHNNNAVPHQKLEYVEYITEETKSKLEAVMISDGATAKITVIFREANQFYGGSGMNVFVIPNVCRPIDTGVIHTEDGMRYSILYDNENDRYVMELFAVDGVLTAPSDSGMVHIAYAVADYELKDIRVGADGTIYPTAGEAVREQIKYVSDCFDNLTIEGYDIGDQFKDIKAECEMIAGRFFRCPDSDMVESTLWNCYTYPVRAGERYRIRTYTVSAGAAIAFMAMEWDADEIDPAIYYYPTTASSGEIVDAVITVPVGAVQMLVNERPDKSVASIGKLVGKKFTKNDAGVAQSVLNGKRLVCCGDSITEAINPNGGYFVNYAEIVADRHGMICHKDGVGGSTMAYGKGKSFSISRYLNVPEFDYLTIWFGWNDAAYSKLGTIEDVSNDTFYGAYKMVLEHLITNNPTKKIGIIVPYGSDAVDPFAQAVRDVSALYGVPCLDLKDSNRCSLLWGTENAVQLARRNALTYDGTHPNQSGYDYLSTMYEQFLLSL